MSGGRPTSLLLAISGGRDSMALLHALVASPARARIAAVATFDHASGPHSRQAVRLVRQTCAKLELPFETARATIPLHTEAELRAARWAFLRAAASRRNARIVTAHTDDDQLETVLMRVMRHAGARGLAGLYAESNVLRPLLHATRAEITAYVREHDLAFIEDPTNQDRRYLRNRIRLDILPALVRAEPALPEHLRRIACEAAAWRRDVEAVVDGLPIRTLPARTDGGASRGEETGGGEVIAGSTPVAADGAPASALAVHVAALAPHDQPSLRILWPAIAARLGVALDRRGTIRLAQFTKAGATGARIQLSGGWEAVRTRDEIVIRKMARPDARPRARRAQQSLEQPLEPSTRVGRFRFRTVPQPAARGDDPWMAILPADRALTVRPWRPGDRMQASPGSAPRRVKRFLSDARIYGPDRADWPVVLAEGRIIWIPGVRRGVLDGATRPGMTRAYVCDHVER